MLHRNSQKRFYGYNRTYYIVTKTYRNFPFFQNEIFCDLFIEELRLCRKLKRFELYAFSIMPDHVNLLLRPGDECNISQIIKSIKENFSRDANRLIMSDSQPVGEGDTSTCRLPLRMKIVDCKKRFLRKYGKNQIVMPKFK